MFNIKLAGDFDWIGDKSSAEGATPLKGNYLVYFGQFNTPADANNWAIFVDSASGLSTSFDADSAKLHTNKTDDPDKHPPYGSSFTTTGEDGFSGFDLEIDNGRAQARRVDDTTIEVRYRYDGADGTDGGPTEAILMDLDYIYVGAATSNPSSVSDFFANDHFTSTGATSPRLDTILIRNTAITAVPEPSAFLFLGMVAGLGAVRIWTKRS